MNNTKIKWLIAKLNFQNRIWFDELFMKKKNNSYFQLVCIEWMGHRWNLLNSYKLDYDWLLYKWHFLRTFRFYKDWYIFDYYRMLCPVDNRYLSNIQLDMKVAFQCSQVDMSTPDADSLHGKYCRVHKYLENIFLLVVESLL